MVFREKGILDENIKNRDDWTKRKKKRIENYEAQHKKTISNIEI